MSPATIKLGLTTYDDIDEPTVKDWRESVNKNVPESAFKIIDQFAIDTDERIDTLEEKKKLFRVFATEGGTNSYIATTSSNLSNIVDGIQIQLSVDVTNVGVPILNLNSLGAKVLQKVSPTGTRIDLETNDLIANKVYSFEYQDGVWVLIGGITLSQIVVNEGTTNQLLITGVNNTIENSEAILYNGKIAGESVNIDSDTLDIDASHNIKLKDTGVTTGNYIGISIDSQGRITNIDTPNPAGSGISILRSDDSVLSWATSSPDSDKLGGNLPEYYMPSADESISFPKLGANTIGMLGTLSSGWMSLDVGWSYGGTSLINVGSNAAYKFKIGDLIKFTQNSVTKYFYVTQVNSSSLNLSGSIYNYSLTTSTITSPSYSRAIDPLGFFGWVGWQAIYDVEGGTPPSFVIVNGRKNARIYNRNVYLDFYGVSYTSGEGTSRFEIELPIKPLDSPIYPAYTSMGASNSVSVVLAGTTYYCEPRYHVPGSRAYMYFFNSSPLNRALTGDDFNISSFSLTIGTNDRFKVPTDPTHVKYLI